LAGCAWLMEANDQSEEESSSHATTGTNSGGLSVGVTTLRAGLMPANFGIASDAVSDVFYASHSSDHTIQRVFPDGTVEDFI
jgi:hypothetical protein